MLSIGDELTGYRPIDAKSGGAVSRGNVNRIVPNRGGIDILAIPPRTR
jgi:hypothetical protein